MMHYWFYGPGYDVSPGFSILGFIFQVIFWGLIIMLIVKLFKHSHSSSCCHGNGEIDEVSEDRSLEIVRERYAKGEITKKEFEQLKKDLS